MLHHFAFWKPNEGSGTECAVVRHQVALEHVHSVTQRMSVAGIDYTGRIPNQADQNAGFRVGKQFLPEKSAPNLFVEPFFPGHGLRVDCKKLAWIHIVYLAEILPRRKKPDFLGSVRLTR